MKKTYTTEFKAKVVLELLKEESTISQLSSKCESVPGGTMRFWAWQTSLIKGLKKTELEFYRQITQN